LRRSGFYYHEDFLKHNTGSGHPERPERLQNLMWYLQTTETFASLIPLAPRPAENAWIELVHPASYIQSVQKACKPDLHFLDSDTVVSEGSYETALLAAGAAIAACEAVMNGEIQNAFCAVRPPGHHAEREQAMGFCLFNNVAIAARYLQKQHGIEKVCVIDWDVHHGNGTQNEFYSDPTVYYISIHQHPLYPGTGMAHERGVGEGEGVNLNFPCPAGYGDVEYLDIFEKQIAPEVRRFKPDFILVSAGFDAHHRDPLASMEVTEAGFGTMTEIVKGLADECCQGRLVSVLEGGYDLEALACSVEMHLTKMLE
jgi:acetoin utilization deacetylase AcuC-like enzyme